MAIPDAAFSEVPVLSLALARDPKTKGVFLTHLRDALLNVGFLYISDTGLPPQSISQVIQQTNDFFNEAKLPFVEKESIEMKNQKSFLGWSRVRIDRSLICSTFTSQICFECFKFYSIAIPYAN